MNNIEKFISPLIKSQFPEFYKEQGSLFILFVEEYFKWLESSNFASYDDTLINGNPIYHARRLLEYSDIDRTVDEFLVYFKEKYLKNVEIQTSVSRRKLIKAAQDLFSSKGSERSLDLFFRLVYGTNVQIYYPGEDVIKPSDGTWILPVYLELSRSDRTKTYVGKQITGSISGATAFIEYLITRNINGKLIDIAYLSSKQGNFITGELILDDPAVDDAPVVTGSLTSLSITEGGELFSVGEEVTLVSARGVEGRALVTEVESVTGIVRFSIIDGGWGFTTTSETNVSEKSILVSNTRNTNASITNFQRNETVVQYLVRVGATDVTGELSTGSTISNRDTTNTATSTITFINQNILLSPNTANIIINQIQANILSNSIFFDINKSIIATNTEVRFSVGDTIVQANSSANNVRGTVSSISNVVIIEANTSTISSNGVHVGNYVVQNTSGATGFISIIPRENNYTFTNVSHLSISSANGTFTNTDSISIYPSESNTTLISNFDPVLSYDGYQYSLVQTNLQTNTRFSFSNTVLISGAATVNTKIVIASDVGGIIATSSDITATGNVFASNTSTIGLVNVNNNFFATGNTILIGSTSNTVSNSMVLYTGSGADFSIGVLENFETVRVANDYISSNNVGTGGNSVRYVDMLITGGNSSYGYATSVSVFNSGTGYSNSDVVTFTGGNTGAGSYEIGNASIITDSSGSILNVILSANNGNNITTNPNVSIVTSTGTNANVFPGFALGFPKDVSGDINSPLINILFFNNKVVGSISSLTAINPGEDYNVSPFATAYERDIATYGKRDIVLEIDNVTGPGFIGGEYIEQTINAAALLITSNTFSGNSSSSYEPNEVVYSTDGISNVASGIIYSTTRDSTTNVYSTVLFSNTGNWQNSVSVSLIEVSTNTGFNTGDTITQDTANGVLVTSNSTLLVVSNVSGTFAANSTNVISSSTGTSVVSNTSTDYIYKLIGATSNGVTLISNTGAFTSSTLARSVVRSNFNDTTLFLKRISLFTEFQTGGTIVGKTSGTTARVLSSTLDSSSGVVGDNALITANVIASEGSIRNIQVIDSGFGFENNDEVTINSEDLKRLASGKANVSTQGTGVGFYSSSRGFPDNNKFIFDGDYYQNFSYEVQTSIPLELYFSTLKQVLHVSGKKLFGKVSLTPTIDFNVTGSTTIELT